MATIFNDFLDDNLTELLKKGSVGIIPTDTVYGLVCLANNQESLSKINKLKGRSGRPGTIIAASLDQLLSLGLNSSELEAASRYWPNPISLILSSPKRLEYLDLGVKSVAVRIPNHQKLLNFLTNVGPLVSSSANITNQETVTSIEQARLVFGDKVDFYVEGGDLTDKQPSTIAKLNNGILEVIRPGAYLAK